MTQINLSGFASAAEDALKVHATKQARELAKQQEKIEKDNKATAAITSVFQPLVDALTALPPDKDGKRFRTDIFHHYPTELVVAYIKDDWRVMASSPPMGRAKPRDGFVITGGDNSFQVQDMTQMNGNIYKAAYKKTVEEALGFIGGILPKIAPERTQEMVAAITRAYGGGNVPSSGNRPTPEL